MVHGDGAGPGQRPRCRSTGRPAAHSTSTPTRARFRVARTFDGLGRGAHTITVRVLGRGRESATDTQVVVDAFRTGGRLVANLDLRATWGVVEKGQASGGGVGSRRSRALERQVSFRGTGIDWFTYRGPDQGARRSPRRVARWDGGQLRGVAGVRRGAFVHRSRGRRTHVSDRGPRGRAPRGGWSARLDRPVRDRSVSVGP